MSDDETTIHHYDEPTVTIPQAIFKRLVIYALVAGVFGGGLGSYGYLRYFRNSIPTDRRQTIVQETSAVVDVVKKVSPSVVSITSQTTTAGIFGFGQVSQGAGTGIIISADGLILTNKHVVPLDASTFSVFTSDGKEYKNATVVSRDPANDLAFVRIKASGLRAAILGDSSQIAVGQRVVAIGNALGQYQNTVTEGIISGLGRPVTAQDESTSSGAERLENLFQTDAAINPGNSGGPLVDLDGQVIGINTAVAGNAQNIGFAIPINEAKAAIESVKKSGKIVTPYLGVRYIPITKDFASRNNLKQTTGAYVVGDQQNLAVLPDSPAAKAGIQQNDIIMKIGGKQIDDKNSLTSLISKYKVGDKVELEVVRGDKTLKLTATLEEAPQAPQQ